MDRMLLQLRHDHYYVQRQPLLFQNIWYPASTPTHGFQISPIFLSMSPPSALHQTTQPIPLYSPPRISRPQTTPTMPHPILPATAAAHPHCHYGPRGLHSANTHTLSIQKRYADPLPKQNSLHAIHATVLPLRAYRRLRRLV